MMKVSKIDQVMLVSQYDKAKSEGKENIKKMTVKRDVLELSEEAKKLKQERDGDFVVTSNREPAEAAKNNVKRAEILPFKKMNETVSRYSVGAE